MQDVSKLFDIAAALEVACTPYLSGDKDLDPTGAAHIGLTFASQIKEIAISLTGKLGTSDLDEAPEPTKRGASLKRDCSLDSKRE